MKPVNMKVLYGKDSVRETWQTPFDEKIKCDDCGKEARIAFVAIEDGKDWQNTDFIANYREKTDVVWPHDCAAFAVYICTSCGEAHVLWNQA